MSEHSQAVLERAKRTASPSSNWWQSLSPARRATFISWASSRLMPEQLGQMPPARHTETDEYPICGRNRIQVLPIIGFEYGVGITSATDAVTQWRRSVGHLFRLADTDRDEWAAGLVLIFGSPDLLFLPMGRRDGGASCGEICPLDLIVSPETTAPSCCEVQLDAVIDDEPLTRMQLPNADMILLPWGLRETLFPLFEPELPGAEPPPIGTEQSGAELARAIAQC